MKAVVQVVNHAKLSVDGEVVSEIQKGFVVFFGVKTGDKEEQADYLVKKIAGLRVFKDDAGKTNLSLNDVQGEVLFVSQFTLYANTEHGNRPDFLLAEKPERANELYRYAGEKLSAFVPVKYGVFGADMLIEQENDGPFTVIMEK